MFKKLIFFLLVLVFLLQFGSAGTRAETEDNSSISAKIQKVKHIANIRERLSERIALFFKFSPEEKINYQKSLAEKRLSELQYVIDNKRGELIEEASSRYSTYLGRLTNLMVSKRDFRKRDEILNMLEQHSKVVEELTSKIERDSGFWLLLQHNANSIKLYSDQIKNFK